ncbi:MAG: hypothetical protein K0S37_3711 [Microbacterium sp.]|nr:hypothetical protein [Microbacterium sp.]
MTDNDLDTRLSRMARRLPPAVEAEAGRLARDTMPPRLRKGRAPRAPWVLPVVLAGGIALTAGASTAVVAMSHWAGVSMPTENIRNTQPIPVTWTTPTGHTERCRVWIELRHPASGDATTLDAAITARDWDGVGQDLYDAAPTYIYADDPDGEQRVVDGLEPIVRAFSEQAFPGILWFGEGVDSDARAVDMWGMTCAPTS